MNILVKKNGNLNEIVRGNVDVDTLKKNLLTFLRIVIYLLPFFDLKTDEGLLDRLDYDFGMLEEQEREEIEQLMKN